MDPVAVPAATVHPLIAALFEKHGFEELDLRTFDEASARPGPTLLLLLEDPARFRETLDLAVIAPEIARAFAGRFRCAAAMPEAAREIAVRFGVRRWPALVMLRDGGYVGAIEGLRNWDEYAATMASLLVASVKRAPGIGVAVRGDAGGCTAP